MDRTPARQWLGSYMAGSRAENRRRRQLLTRLASALNRSSAAAYPVRARLWLTWRLVPYVSVHAAGRPRLRVYCAGRDGRYALLTGNGRVIRLDEGIAAAAAVIEAACAGLEPGEPVTGPAVAVVQPGP
jgi:hypothetical protein